MPLDFYIKSDDCYLSVRLWIPSTSRNEAVVFCHGWAGGARYDDLLEVLSERGYYTLRLDQRGYGASTGQADLSLWANDMAICAAALGSVAKRVWASGQSTGGTIALTAASTHDCFVGAVAFAPFSSLEGIIRDNVNARSVLEEHFGPLHEKHYEAANAIKLVQGLNKPVLLVHGTKDQTVPFEHGQALYRQIGSNAQFLPVQGANHHLTNVDRSLIITEVVNWLGKQSLT